MDCAAIQTLDVQSVYSSSSVCCSLGHVVISNINQLFNSPWHVAVFNSAELLCVCVCVCVCVKGREGGRGGGLGGSQSGVLSCMECISATESEHQRGD